MMIQNKNKKHLEVYHAVALHMYILICLRFLSFRIPTLYCVCTNIHDYLQETLIPVPQHSCTPLLTFDVFKIEYNQFNKLRLIHLSVVCNRMQKYYN